MSTLEFPLLGIEEEEWLLKNYQREFLKDKSYEELRSLLPYPECSFDHIMAGFVIELMSISFSNVEEDNDKIYGIYGTIHLVDGEGSTFDLYDRKHDNPETISNGGVLTITLPTDRAITATQLAELHIDLKDIQTGVEVVKNVFDWDCTIRDCYDQVRHTKSFHGEGGSVVVDFVSYSHAVVCNVDVEALTDFDGVNIYGDIIASCARKFSTILFEKKQNDSVNVKPGTNLQLSRRVVIAPAFTPSLNIHVNLFNGDNHEMIVEETIQFGIWNTRGSEAYDGSSGLIEAQVQWNHPSLQPHLFPAPKISRGINNIGLFPYGPKLLEIYSVSVGHMAEDIDIWGSIKFWLPGTEQGILFSADKSSPQKLLPGGLVPLPSYTDLLVCGCGAFTIALELRDASDQSISWGNVVWDERALVKYQALLGWQLCSVVRSVNGYYGAVHYSVFCAGVQVLVEIHLKDESLKKNYFKVDGSICAEYSGYDYSTAYQKEYYRRKLFVRKSHDPLLAYPFYSLLLSKSSVMVPEGSALMIDVNLNVISSQVLSTLGVAGVAGDSGGDSSFVKLVEFNSDDINRHEIVQKEINRSSLQMVIQVEWRRTL